MDGDHFLFSTKRIYGLDGYVHISISEDRASAYRFWKLPLFGHLKVLIKLEKLDGKYLLSCLGEKKVLFKTAYDFLPSVVVNNEEAKMVLDTMLSIEKVEDFSKFIEVFYKMGKMRMGVD